MTASAVDIVAQAIRIADGDHSKGAGSLAEAIVEHLDGAGFVIRKKPTSRKAAAPVEPFAPNTGDPQLDEFMRSHHNPKWKPGAMPKAPSGYVSGRLSEKAFDAMNEGWNSACTSRRGDSEEAAALRASDAATLAEVIRRHRSPWTFRGDVYTSTEHGYTVEHLRDSRYSASYDGWRVTDPSGNVVPSPTGDVKFYRFEDAERAILSALA